MDAATVSSALQTLGLEKFLPILLALHALASATDAILPQPAPGSHWLPLRKLVSIAAGNVLNATNGKQPAMVTWLQRVLLKLATMVPEPPDPPPSVKPVAAPATSSIPVLTSHETH